MAWGRKKGGARKEPLFGLPAALADLRLSPSDRIPGGGDDKPAKSKPKSSDKGSDSGSEKPRPSRSGSKRRSKSRGFGIGRLF
jgi:penicillin-binding protein 1A